MRYRVVNTEQFHAALDAQLTYFTEQGAPERRVGKCSCWGFGMEPASVIRRLGACSEVRPEGRSISRMISRHAR